MYITYLGLILVPYICLLSLKKIESLFLNLVFFSSFTSLVIIKLGDIAIVPYHLIGFIFILKYSMIKLKLKDFKININKWLLMFIIMSGLSIINSLYINDNQTLVNGIDGGAITIGYSLTNVTQYIYLLFGFVIYIFTFTYLCEHKEEIVKFIEVFIYSIVCVCLLGLLQEIIYIMNKDINFFNAWFRDNPNISTQGMGGILRMTSVFLEPSVFAQYLAPALAIGLFFKYKNVKNRIVHICLILICGVLSMSTSFMLGCIVLLTILSIEILNIKKLNNKKVWCILIVLFLIVITFIITYKGLNNGNVFITSYYNDILSKLNLSNKSGKVRSSHVLIHLTAAIKYPLLGIGFGTCRSSDLITTWLANTGFITVGIFIIYLRSILIKLRLISNKDFKAKIYYYYLIILFIISFISVPEPYYIYIWMSLALSESLIYHNKLEQNEIMMEYKLK